MTSKTIEAVEVLVTIAKSEKIEMVAVLGNTVMLVTSNYSAVRNNSLSKC